MSDTSQGPGWWLASDGRWYPPTSQPGPTSILTLEADPVAPPPHRQTKPGVWVVLALVVVALIWGGVSSIHSPSDPGGSGGSNGSSAQSGVTLDGQPVSMALANFTDPATDGSGYTGDGQTKDHYSIVNISVTNNGNSTLPATLPMTIAGFDSDGQTYQSTSSTPSDDTLCSTGGESAFSPTETLNYCAGFVLPETVTITRVEVSGNEPNGTGTLSWNVNDGFGGWSGSSN